MPATPWAPPSSFWSPHAFPGRSDPGELRDVGRRSFIIVIYYFLCNGCYETWDLVYQARLGMCERWSLPIKAPHGNEQVGQEPSSRFLQTSLERGAEAGLGSAGGGQPAMIACYLWEPRGRKGAGFGAPCTTAGSDQLWLQGGLGHSWSCHNIDPGGDNIQRAWSPSRIRRGMSPEKIPGPQGDQTKWGFNRSLPAQISWVIGSRS